MSDKNLQPIYLKDNLGRLNILCNISESVDFTSIIKFPADSIEIHIHPTGWINFRSPNHNSTIYLNDPYLFDGAQPIAVIRHSFAEVTADNTASISQAELANTLEVSHDPTQILIMI